MLSRDRLLVGHLILLGLIVLGCNCLPLAVSTETLPPSLSVRVGEGVRIPCPLAGPGASVQWLQNGAPVVLEGGRGGHREWAVSAEGAASLAIEAARLSDAGEWGCREMSADGGVRRTAAVLSLEIGSVPSTPHLEMEGRRLLHQATVTVKEPQSLSLYCIVTGASPPVRHIHWFVGESNATSSSELFVEFSGVEGAYTSRSVLVLNATRTLHGREVVCRAHHAAWLRGAAASVSLNVLYEPSFSISRDPGFGLPLVEGMRVSLLCQVDANPPSPPTWVRDDAPPDHPPEPTSAEEGTLSFDPIARDRHSGWYRCTTHNEEFGFFASFGYFLNVRAADPTEAIPVPGSGSFSTVGCIPDGRPEVTAVNRSLAGLSGRSALLSGQLCSSPRPHRVFWLLRHTVLRPGDARHPYVAHNLTETEVPGCWMVSLEVVRLSLDDSGEVVLIATNPRGTADATFLLNVTHASLSRTSSAAPRTGVFGACALLILLFPTWLRWTLDNR